MTDFRNLNVWKKGHDLTVKVYSITHDFPDSERFGLKLQMRKTCSQIPMSIANSCGSEIDQDVIRVLHSAARSCSEFEYQCILARSLGFLGEETETSLVNDVRDVRKMIFGYLKSIKG